MKMRKIQRNISAVVACGAMIYLATGISGSLHKHPAYADEPVTECEATVTEEDYNWYHKDAYLLAKIAMAEAEGEDTVGKALVIRTVLNRVESDKFPESRGRLAVCPYGNRRQMVYDGARRRLLGSSLHGTDWLG